MADAFGFNVRNEDDSIAATLVIREEDSLLTAGGVALVIEQEHYEALHEEISLGIARLIGTGRGGEARFNDDPEATDEVEYVNARIAVLDSLGAEVTPAVIGIQDRSTGNAVQEVPLSPYAAADLQDAMEQGSLVTVL